MDTTLVIIVPSFNTAAWYERNRDSILSHSCEQHAVLHVDDASSDGTGDLVADYPRRQGQEQPVTLVTNPRRVKSLANIYDAVHTCDPDTVVVLVDGDDALAHDQVLWRLNGVYQDPAVWMPSGQLQSCLDGAVGSAAPVPAAVVAENQFREYPGIFTHLRTFYAGLFQKICREDPAGDAAGRGAL